MNLISAVTAILESGYGNGLILDVRDPVQYEAGHYPGAWRASSEAELLVLPKDRELYLYCT